MRQRKLLGYVVLLAAAYVVGLAGTIATGRALMSRMGPSAARIPVTIEAPVAAPAAPLSPRVPVIDC
ncbi:MAG: hypothetical protein AAB426_06435 [Myxococcota bacterium]